MAYTKYSLTPANNNAAPPDGAPEGMLPSAVNDTMRDMMAQIRDCGDGIRGGTYTMTAPVITGGSISGASVSATSLTDSGNLTFTGTGNRITGDFTTGLPTSAAFQTSTTNGSTILFALPNGTSTQSNLILLNGSDTTNYSRANIRHNTTAFTLANQIAGTGSYVPFTIETGGSERLRIDTSGNVGIGTTSPAMKLDVSGGGIKIGYQAAPTWTTDSFLWSESGVGLNIDGFNLKFNTGATRNERMRIDSSGNVGIGVSSPSSYGILTAYAASNPTLTIASGNSNAYLRLNTTSDANMYLTNTGGSMTMNTANTERMRIDSSGNVGILNSNPATILETATWGTGLAVGTTSGTHNITIVSSTTSTLSALRFGDGGSGVYDQGYLIYDHANNAMLMGTNRAERMRLTNSALLFGKTTDTVGVSGLAIQPLAQGADTGANAQWNKTASGSYYASQYVHGSTLVGSITYTDTATTFATSSDYRLKENIAPMTGALNVVQQLKPVTYTWKSDGSVGQGFIAHELQAVVPDCVTGEKDAVDAEGSPVYQGIDASFLVATLTAAIKEQQVMIQELQAKVAALEAA